jgi:RHS repeat-associated protein
VTGICEGVSLLPNGVHFSESNPASITLSYNPARIPMGYKPDEIYTYYCDDAQHWYRLERVAVDTIAHTVTSLTTHFTDFANAVIKVPEMPESKAFVPTAMTDLPDADPMKGIPMVEAPTPNNMGTAELTYPIELPKGRHGMQPNVDLHYSSAGGNGILGVGWSLSTPAITLDTRWGVPRYDQDYETEQYLVNGATVLLRKSDGKAKDLPYQNNSFLPREKGAVRFYARDTKNQDRIIRYGNSPTNYYWAVTDRNGITTYYGRSFDPNHPDDNSIDEESVIRTGGPNSNIAYWAATASVDIFGNYILYRNSKQGNNIYVEQISYTGNYMQGVPPIYRILLTYKNNRSDASTNGRLGVLQTENRLLCNIIVQYLDPRLKAGEADNLAAYYMQYNNPNEKSLFKSRLDNVIMLDSVHDIIAEIQTCNFAELALNGRIPGTWRNSLSEILLEEARAEAERTHDESQLKELEATLSKNYGANGVPASITSFHYADAPLADSALFAERHNIPKNGEKLSISQSQSTSWNLGGNLIVGPGADVATSTVSGGANYDYSRSNGGCKTMLLDLNGDGLQDLVYEDKGKVYYCKQEKQGNRFAAPLLLDGLTRLSHEVSNTHTWGLQLSFGANLSYNNPISTTYTDAYFSDINADGLPDMIDRDSIYINQLVNGVPHFGAFTGVNSEHIQVHNNICGKGIIFDGEVDERVECEMQETLVNSYLLDSIYNSPGFYEQGVQIVDVRPVQYPEMRYAEAGGYKPTEHHSEYPDKPSYTPSTISNDHFQLPAAGDSLIYRIEGDKLNVYRIEPIRCSAKFDPEIENVRVWVAPKNGSFVLRDTIALLRDSSISRTYSRTADGISYTILHCHNVRTKWLDTKHLQAGWYTIVRQGTIAANDYNPHGWEQTIYAQEGDIIMYRLRSGENNLYDKTRWHHVVQDGSRIYDSERDFVCTGDGHFQAYKAGRVILTLRGSNDGSVPVKVNVVKNGTTIRTVTLSRGALNTQVTSDVQANDKISIRVTYDQSEPYWGDIHVIPELQYISDFPRDNAGTQLAHDTVTYYPDVQIVNYSSVQKDTDSPYRQLFGPLHKGWGEFAYQKDSIDQDIIILDSLVNTQLEAVEYTKNNRSYLTSYQPNITVDDNIGESDLLAQANNAFAATGTYNPISKSNHWIPMRADSRTEQWITYGNMGCIGRQVHSNAREITMQGEGEVEEIVEYDSSLPFAGGETRKNKFVRKTSRSIQHSISAGVFMFGRSATFGSYNSLVDYMDMNGDGYPDFVGKSGIQYSKPWGGIGEFRTVPNYSAFNSKTCARGNSFSACPGVLEKSPGNNIRNGKFHMGVSAGASGGFGTSSTKIQFMDVNADGLPDKVDIDNKMVYYNLGYSFSNPYPLYVSVSEGYNANVSVSAGVSTGMDYIFENAGSIANQNKPDFSVAQVSITGGVSVSGSRNNINEQFMDINGDGLPDKVIWNEGSVLVAFNKGNNDFAPYRTLKGIDLLSQDNTANVGVNLGATAGITFSVVRIDFGIQCSPFGMSFIEGDVAFTDMNGDGLVDYVRKSGDNLEVSYNGAGRANLLTSVTNPTGQEIGLNYRLSNPSVEHRSRQWELVSVIDEDPNHPMGAAQKSITQIGYDSAYYDNYERTDYGYNTVYAIHNGEKVKEEYYYNQSLIQKGELREDWLKDTGKNGYIHHWRGIRYKDIRSDKEIDINTNCEDANTCISQDGYWTEYYEGETKPQITTRYTIQYDKLHNMVEYADDGDISTSADNWRQEITYLHNTANNMISLPLTEQVFDSNNKLIRSSFVDYNYFGKPARIRQNVDANQEAETYLQYDDFGNVSALIAPMDANHENRWSAFEYDSVVHSYVVSIDNPYHTQTHTAYDYRWGLPIRTMDPSGNSIWYRYDYKGRLEKVIAPREFLNGNDYTVKYTYNLINHNIDPIHKVSYPFTHVYKDICDSLQKELTLFDGRGRMLQKKHYAEVNGNKDWVVDGAEEWDVFGRPIAQGIPFLSSGKLQDYESIKKSPAIVTTQYDILDRPVVQTNADGSLKKMRYHFGKDKNSITRFLNQVIDEKGVITSTLKSPQDWLIQQIAGDGSSTFFEYSPIGELLRTTDAEGYQTTYEYDMLGRNVKRIHPDAGETRMEYDLAGNLISEQTANLIATGGAIQYIYKYARLMDIHYPHHAENDVHYTYDKAGRIKMRTDGIGSEEFLYDRMGNVAQSLLRIIIPTEQNAYVFRTRYEYDSFGRMRSIVYPDGEVVQYNYTTGGLLKNVFGTKNGWRNDYLADRGYDEQGRKIYQKDGNGAWTEYTYDKQRQWLNRLYTELPSRDIIQDIKYKYDAVGNITHIDQSAPAFAGGKLGGTYTNDYLYDRQYRLVWSDGSGDFSYKMRANYSPAGKMGNKFTGPKSSNGDLLFGYDQMHKTHQPRTIYDSNAGTMDLYWDANGNLAQVIGCKQNSGRLHEWDEENRLRFVLGEKYAGYYGYDANGERVYKLTGMSVMDQVNSGSTKAQAIFDDAVLYPNPYMVVTRRGYTKHYYAGTERLATVIGGGGLNELTQAIVPADDPHDDEIKKTFGTRYLNYDPFRHQGTVGSLIPTEDINGQPNSDLRYQCMPVELGGVDIVTKKDMLLAPIKEYGEVREEKEKFFYHGDHLGSANWITESSGIPVQYIHYAPYGEMIANQRPMNYDERYKFTGKERDRETGYDMFGARYLWSDAGIWTSVDPLVGDYPWISPYAYGLWNPIKYIDPDGRKCTLSVNYKTNTITISAKYYALKGDSRYAQKAANFWNNQKGLTYTAKDGTNYSVQFALNVYSSKNPEKDAGTDDNTFKIVSMLGTNTEGYKKTGVTEANYKISVVDAYKEETTAAHEVGHTLMNVQGGQESEHTTTGVMTKSISDKGRSASVSQETVNSIVESNGFKQNPTLWQKIRSWFE